MAVSSVPVRGAADVVSAAPKLFAGITSWRYTSPVVSEMVDLNASVYPITTMLDKLGRVQEVGSTSFEHQEQDSMPTYITLGAQATAGDVTLTVGATDYLMLGAGTILQNPATGENISVTTKPTTTTVTVIKGHGGTTDATIANSTKLQIMAQSATDGAAIEVGFTTEPNRQTNYMQIHRTPFSLSRRAINAALKIGPAILPGLKVQKIQEHMEKIEKAIFFNKLDTGVTSNHKMVTGGLDYWVTNLVETIAAGGTLTQQTFDNWIKACHYYNQGQDLLFVCGEYVVDHMNAWARDAIFMRPEDQVTGVHVNRYRCSEGEIKWIKHGMFNTAYEGSGASSGRCYAINMNFLKLAVYKGGPFNKLTQVADYAHGGTDGETWEVMSDFGVWVGPQRRHGILKGVPALT